MTTILTRLSVPDKALPMWEGGKVNDLEGPLEHPAVLDPLDIGLWPSGTPKRKFRGSPDPSIRAVLSIARLRADKSASREADSFRARVLALGAVTTETLVVRIATTDDPLMVWAIHRTLARRGVPPCLRWPTNDSTPQMEFIAWLADLLWLVKRNPDHEPKFKSWKRLFKLRPGSPNWCERAYRMFEFAHARSLGYYSAKALGLTPDQRLGLMTVPTVRMVATRRALQSDEFTVTRGYILSHAHGFPDKSGTRPPDAVARRRAGLWRTHLLSDEIVTTTTRNWALLSGEVLTRQAVSKQIDIVQRVLQGAKEFG